jgi:hypothetical protein
MRDGRTLSVPMDWYPRLAHGSPRERQRWRLIGGGIGIHWPDLDEDISISGLLAGLPSGESAKSLKQWLASRRRPSKKGLQPSAVHVVLGASRRASPARLAAECGVRLRQRESLGADFRHTQISRDLPCEVVGNLGVTGNSFDRAGSGVGPEGVGSTFSLEHTPVFAQVFQESAALHFTVTVSRSASGGTPRSPSSRRSSRMSAMASARLRRASSFVRPCPLAPGISGLYAIYQSASRSNTAVNSLCIGDPTIYDTADRGPVSNTQIVRGKRRCERHSELSRQSSMTGRREHVEHRPGRRDSPVPRWRRSRDLQSFLPRHVREQIPGPAPSVGPNAFLSRGRCTPARSSWATITLKCSQGEKARWNCRSSSLTTGSRKALMKS